MASPGVCINLVNGTTTRLPTNADLVVHYLHRRTIQEPMPCDFITNVNILQHNPWDIVPAEEKTNGKHFFIHEENERLGDHRSNRAAGDGFWKPAGSEVPVYHKRSGGADEALVGMKRTLVFHYGNSSSAKRTEWVMQEFRLAGATLIPCPMTRPATGDGSMHPCHRTGTTIATENDGSPSAGQTHGPLEKTMVEPDSSLRICCIYKKRQRAPQFIIPPSIGDARELILALPAIGNTREVTLTLPAIDFLGQPSFEEGSDVSADVITDDKDGYGHGMN
uniref:NAC domain-containing protein n=1 Tax=Oryza meridionalis TaxID=40149 RepID=A0A0E0F616_9ORYZ